MFEDSGGQTDTRMNYRACLYYKAQVNKWDIQINIFLVYRQKDLFWILIRSASIWLVCLQFNGPVNTIKVKLSQSSYLTTLFLGRFNPLSG